MADVAVVVLVGAVVAFVAVAVVVVVDPVGTVTTTCVHSVQFNGKSFWGKNFVFLVPSCWLLCGLVVVV